MMDLMSSWKQILKCLECLEELTIEERERGAIYSQAINVAVWAENADRIFWFKFEPDNPVGGQRPGFTSDLVDNRKIRF